MKKFTVGDEVRLIILDYLKHKKYWQHFNYGRETKDIRKQVNKQYKKDLGKSVIYIHLDKLQSDNFIEKKKKGWFITDLGLKKQKTMCLRRKCKMIEQEIREIKQKKKETEQMIYELGNQSTVLAG